MSSWTLLRNAWRLFDLVWVILRHRVRTCSCALYTRCSLHGYGYVGGTRVCVMPKFPDFQWLTAATG